MREALVAVFDTAPHADEAVRALEIANVPATDIRRYHKDDPSIPHANYLSQTEQQGDFHSAKASIVAFGHGYSERSIEPIGETQNTRNATSSSTHALSVRVIPWWRCTSNRKPSTV